MFSIYSIFAFGLVIGTTAMMAAFIMDGAAKTAINVKDIIIDELADDMNVAVGGQGPFTHCDLKDARMHSADPYRTPQQPTPVKPTPRQVAEDANQSTAQRQVYAALDVADAIRELVAAIKDK